MGGIFGAGIFLSPTRLQDFFLRCANLVFRHNRLQDKVPLQECFGKSHPLPPVISNGPSFMETWFGTKFQHFAETTLKIT